ncbi:hypothetical protein BGX28_000069 [Mortierella sp. GBA30]|nr:hypothetical protein BGX28_000069 [Mortierella sp. GBA30]
MIPSKRASPFTRTKSFQNTQPRNGQQHSDQTTPFSKRPALARTTSSPFQVLSPSLKNIKNPFEKLALAPAAAFPETVPVKSAESPLDEDNLDDEALDPNKTLQMFSFSQPMAATATNDPGYDPLDSEEEDLLQEAKQGTEDEYPRPMPTRKPRLQEALEMSLNPNRSQTAKELQAPTLSNGTSKKTGSEYRTSESPPLDWAIKNSLSITSRDSLAWCDQGSTLDDTEALQHFLSGYTVPGKGVDAFVFNQDWSLSPRARLLSASYHWCYPANSPTVSQAQSISKMLKNAGNMSSTEKSNIVDLFSRSAEWKQAFTALYQSCRNGACPYFYYIGTSWTILFQHGSVSTSGKIEAVLTNSTPGLRKVLEEEEIKFARLPTMGGKVTIHSFSSKHDLERLDDNDSETTSASDKVPFQMPIKQELSDTLLFEGPVDVHGLFGYLLNLKTSYEDGYLYHSPTLIATVPFLHAALKRAQLSKCKIVSKPVEGTDRIQREFRVEIEGTLLPMSVQALHSVFVDQQPTGYTCIASSDARSHGLNMRPLVPDLSSDKTASGAFVSPKALDQLQYDRSVRLFSWLS